LTETSYDYDVAFSFLQQDEGTAFRISDLLQDRYKTFVYSKAQEKIAGTDGIDTFSEVFGFAARTVAVLYRAGWGETPWTRIEETAIKERTLRDGHDFATFIMLEDGIAAPRWMPRTQLFYSLVKYGIDGAAGALAARIQSQGGQAVVETVANRAARLKREKDFQVAKRAFEFSFEGVRAGTAAYQEFVEGLKQSAEELSAAGLQCRIGKVQGGYGDLLVGDGVVLVSSWQHFAANDLKDAKLTLEFWDGVPPIAGYGFTKPNRLGKEVFTFGLQMPEQTGWLSQSGRPYSTKHLVEVTMKSFMDLQEKQLGRRGR
jgi:hypothetical protein